MNTFEALQKTPVLPGEIMAAAVRDSIFLAMEKHGGRIVSHTDCTPEQLKQAQADLHVYNIGTAKFVYIKP